MKKFRLLLMVTGLTLLIPVAGIAQSVGEISELSPEDRRAYMQSMSEDERKAKRAEWRAEMQAMPEADRNAVREKMAADRPQRGGRDREAAREHWESMSDEERAAAKAQRQERKAQRRETWESMSDEERAAARQKFGQKNGQRKGGGRKGGGQKPQVDSAE